MATWQIVMRSLFGISQSHFLCHKIVMCRIQTNVTIARQKPSFSHDLGKQPRDQKTRQAWATAWAGAGFAGQENLLLVLSSCVDPTVTWHARVAAGTINTVPSLTQKTSVHKLFLKGGIKSNICSVVKLQSCSEKLLWKKKKKASRNAV